MCGIIGYSGRRQAAPVLLDSLARLEYRGYDSAGVAVLDEDGGATAVAKSNNKVADLVLWEAEHEGAFAWAYGLKPRVVWQRGTQVFA